MRTDGMLLHKMPLKIKINKLNNKRQAPAKQGGERNYSNNIKIKKKK
jgi:hypothetical protein